MTNRLRSLVPLVLVSLGIAARAEAATPVARVLETKGKVVVKQKSEQSRNLAALDTVYLDEKVVLVSGSFAVLAFRADGHLERLAQPGELTIGKTGCEPKTGVEMIEAPERHKKLVGATVQSLRPKGSAGVTIFRSPGRDKPPRIVVSPIPRSTVLALRPERTESGAKVMVARPQLVWSPVPGAVTYEVKLKSGEETLWSVTTAGQTHEPGAKHPLNVELYLGKTPLKPGATYEWEVTATYADGTAKYAGSSSFTLATEEQQAHALELKPLAAGTDIAYSTLAAVWYEENNLIQEAEGVYETLIALRSNTAAYYFALGRLYQMEDRTEDAQKVNAKGRQLQPLPAKPPRPEWLQKLPKM